MNDVMDLQNLGWSVSRTGGFEKAGPLADQGRRSCPPGHDPDSLLRAEGAAALTARLDAARRLLSFVLEKALAEEDLTTRARPRQRPRPRRPDPLQGGQCRGGDRCWRARPARRLGVDSTQLWIEAQQLQGARARGRRPDQLRPTGARTAASDSWPPPPLPSGTSLALLLHVDEARAELLPVLEDEDVVHPGLRRVLTALRRAPERAARGADGRARGRGASGGSWPPCSSRSASGATHIVTSTS